VSGILQVDIRLTMSDERYPEGFDSLPHQNIFIYGLTF